MNKNSLTEDSPLYGYQVNIENTPNLNLTSPEDRNTLRTTEACVWTTWVQLVGSELPVHCCRPNQKVFQILLSPNGAAWPLNGSRRKCVHVYKPAIVLSVSCCIRSDIFSWLSPRSSFNSNSYIQYINKNPSIIHYGLWYSVCSHTWACVNTSCLTVWE